MGADAGLGHAEAGHPHHLLEANKGIAWTVGVDGRHGALVARGHRLQHVEGFLAPNLADDDAIGPHSERVLYEFALTDLATPLDARRPGFEPADVRLLELQLGCVLDGDQTLLVRDRTRK